MLLRESACGYHCTLDLCQVENERSTAILQPKCYHRLSLRGSCYGKEALGI